MDRTARSGLLERVARSFDRTTPVALYYQFGQALRNDILSGRLATGDRLPTTEQFAEKLGVTGVTVDRAIRDLVREGHLERKRGVGTVVRHTAQPITARDLVAIAVPEHDHVYSGLLRGVLTGLRDERHYSMVMDISVADVDEPLPENIREKFRRLLAHRPAHLIAYATSRFPFDLLAGYEGQLIFAETCESRAPLKATYVLADHFAGAQAIARHLAALGHTKLAFVVGGPRIGLPNHVKRDFLKGLWTGLGARRPVHDTVAVTFADEEDRLPESFAALLRRPDRPRAVVCLGDYLAEPVYATAAALGLRIPEDLAVVGFYDTPWCHKFDPELTSVSVHEDQIAGHIVRAITEGRGPERILVRPTLVVRESCGGKRT